MKLFKKLFPCIIAVAVLLICVFALPTEAQAAEITGSGICGENLTWTLDSNGTLTISGTGAMVNYINSTNFAHSPWRNNTNIKKVVIEDGVTSIGRDAFYNCYQLTSITFHKSITTIGIGAFSLCSDLEKVIYYGSENQKNAIIIGSYNHPLTSATWVCHNNCKHSYDNICDSSCNLCGSLRTDFHQYGTNWSKNDVYHWHECYGCGDRKDLAVHSWNGNNCAVCDVNNPNATQSTDPTEPQEPVDPGNNGNLPWFLLLIGGIVGMAGGLAAGVVISKKKR